MTDHSATPKRRPLILTVYVFLFLLLFLAVGYVVFRLSGTFASPANAATVAPDRPLVILDAGHGGEDGGAVGDNGVYEKDLNLTLALLLADMLRAADVDVLLTRTEDKLLYREEENIRGHRKEYDLRNRLKIAEGHSGALFISLHMNTFPQKKYSGLQVYYAQRTDGSRALASCIQRAVAATLQPDNDRQIKEADSSIYLLDSAVCRAVLVECGFLSNPVECRLLSEKEYQRRLCFSLFCGIMEYINQTED